MSESRMHHSQRPDAAATTTTMAHSLGSTTPATSTADAASSCQRASTTPSHLTCSEDRARRATEASHRAVSHVRYDMVSTIDAFTELIPPTPCNISSVARDMRSEFDAATRHIAFVNDLLERRRADNGTPTALRPQAHVGGLLNSLELIATATALGRPPTLAPDRGGSGGSPTQPQSVASPASSAGDTGAPFVAGSRPRDLTLPPHCAVLLSEDYALDYTVRIRRHVGEIGVVVDRGGVPADGGGEGSSTPNNNTADSPQPRPVRSSVGGGGSASSPTATTTTTGSSSGAASAMARVPIPPPPTAVADFLSAALGLLSGCSAVPYEGRSEAGTKAFTFGFLTPSSFAVDDHSRVHLRGGALAQLFAMRTGPTSSHVGVDLLRCRGSGQPSALTINSVAGGTTAANDSVMFLAPELLAEMLVPPATATTTSHRFGDAWTPAVDLWSVGVCAVAYAIAGTNAFSVFFGACREALATATGADAREAVALSFVRRLRDVGERLRTHVDAVRSSPASPVTSPYLPKEADDDEDDDGGDTAANQQHMAGPSPLRPQRHIDALDDPISALVVRTLAKRLPSVATLVTVADLLTWDAKARLDTDTARRYHISTDCSSQRHLILAKCPPVALTCVTRDFEADPAFGLDGADADASEEQPLSFVQRCLDRRVSERRQTQGNSTRRDLPTACQRLRQAVERLAVSDAGTNATPDAREALVCTEHLALLLPQWLSLLVPASGRTGCGTVAWPTSAPPTSADVAAVFRQEHASVRGRFFDTHWWRPDWPPAVIFAAVRSNFLLPSASDEAIDVPALSGGSASTFFPPQPGPVLVAGGNPTQSPFSVSIEPPRLAAVAPVNLSEASTRAVAGRRALLVDAVSLVQACSARARAITCSIGMQSQRQGGDGGAPASPTNAASQGPPPVFPSCLDVAYGDGGRRRMTAATVEAAAAASPSLDPPFSVAGFLGHQRPLDDGTTVAGGGGGGDHVPPPPRPPAGIDAAIADTSRRDEATEKRRAFQSTERASEARELSLAQMLLDAAREFRRSAPRTVSSTDAEERPLPWITTKAKREFCQHVRYLLRHHGVGSTTGRAAATIPTTARVEVWAALLGVPDAATCAAVTSSVEVYGITACDRQIAVDIPRCHQYHALLRTTEGHNRIWTAIKRWLALNPDLRYWQGVHDVCAPLLALGWDEGPTVAFCLTRLVREHVPHFFAPNAMRVRIAAFAALLQYHDAPLANHLHRIHDCQPDMYAVSWFLTLFAHVLPTEKVFVLWDAALLSGDIDLFFLCVGVALVRRHRLHLLNSDFSQVVQILFASGGSADIVATVESARSLAAASPPLLRPLREWGAMSAIPGPVQELSVGTILAAYRSRLETTDTRNTAADDSASSAVAAGGVVVFVPYSAADSAGARQPLSQRQLVLGAHAIPVRNAGAPVTASPAGGGGSAYSPSSTPRGDLDAGLDQPASSGRRTPPPPPSSGSLWSTVMRRGRRESKSGGPDVSSAAGTPSRSTAHAKPTTGSPASSSSAAAAIRGVNASPSAAAADAAAVDESWDVVRSPTPPHEEHVSLGGDDSPRFMVSDGRLRRMLHTATFVAPAAAAAARSSSSSRQQSTASSTAAPLIVVMPPPRLTMDGAPFVTGASPSSRGQSPASSEVDADVAALAALLVERYDAPRVAVVSDDGATVASAFVEAGLQHLLLLLQPQAS